MDIPPNIWNTMPPGTAAEIMPVFRTIKGLTLEVAAGCHDPDPQKMMENIQDFFNRLEGEALQLPLFEAVPEADGKNTP